MLFNETKLNKASVSFEIAKKLANGRNLYSPAVLQNKKYDLVFLHHFRTLEHDLAEKTLKKVFSAVNSTNYGAVKVFGTNADDLFKINSSIDLDKTIEALGLEIIQKKSHQLRNGKNNYIYVVRIELTL